MSRFVLLFDEKEGTSPLVRLLDNFADVSIVHQADGGGWEPFDRHNCGAMSLAALEQCLDKLFDSRFSDLAILNSLYTRTARQALVVDPAAPVIGFKMRFVPPQPRPPFLGRLPQWRALIAASERHRQRHFERMMCKLLARHRVCVFVIVRRDILRWSLSKYHGDGTGRSGHLQFALAAGELKRESLSRIDVDLVRLGRLMVESEAAHASKRRLLVRLQRSGVYAQPLFYEDFLADRASYLKRFFELLQRPVSPGAIAAALARGAYFEKVHSDDIAEFVVNHEAVLAHFGRPWNGW